MATEAAEHAQQLPARSRVRTKRRWPLRLALSVIVVAVVLLIAWAARPKPIAVDTVTAERGTVRDQVSSSTAGEVKGEQQATVRAEVAGQVTQVVHHRGDHVKQGETVVTLDAADLEAKLREAAATLAAQRAALTEAQAKTELAAVTAKRDRTLAEHGAGPRQAAVDSAAASREAQAALLSARAQVVQAQASLEAARVARSHADLTAPFAGLIADVYVEQGDLVQPGAQVYQLIDDSRLHVEAPLDEADVERVKVGQPAQLRLDALPGRQVDGVVSKLDPTVLKDEKGARTLRIEVQVQNLKQAVDEGLRAGMSANVDVQVAQKPNVLEVPSFVIVGRGARRSVYRVDHGVVREVPVTVGLSSWDRTEITSGLRPGDRVVSNLNVKGLKDGARVVPPKGRST